MTVQKIASQLVKLCREGKFEAAQKELYADNAVSIEAHATPDFEKETHGLKAILKKGEKFGSMVQHMHGITVSDPMVAGNAFSIAMTMDVTMKGRDRGKFDELCVYQVKDGKIISEQFLM